MCVSLDVPCRAMHTLDACAPRRSHVLVDRCGWLRTRIWQPRLLGALLGYSRIEGVHSREHEPPRKGARGCARRRVPSVAAHHGERRGGRRREAVRVLDIMRLSWGAGGLMPRLRSVGLYWLSFIVVVNRLLICLLPSPYSYSHPRRMHAGCSFCFCFPVHSYIPRYDPYERNNGIVMDGT